MGKYTNQLVNFLASNKNSNNDSLKLGTYDGTNIVCGDLKLDPDDVLVNANIVNFAVGDVFVVYPYSDELYLVLERVVKINEFVTRQSI